MLKRIITGIIAVAILVPVLIFSDTVVFPIALALVGLIYMFEIFKCLGLEKKISVILPAYCASLVFTFLVRYTNIAASIATICALLYLIYIFAHIIWSHGKFAFNDALTAYTLVIYILLSLSSVIFIRDFEEIGKYIYILIFLGAWVTDIFAYFTGVFFGKHKLIPEVSPKKTVE